MRFNDEYRKEMDDKTLSEDFIKNLAARMADEAAKSKNTDKENTETNREQEETEVKVIEYRRNRTMMSVKIIAAACAAAVMIGFGTTLKNKLPNENISVTPDVPVTKLSEPAETGQVTSDNTVTEISSEPVTSVEQITELIPETALTDAAVTSVAEITEEVSVTNLPETEHEDSYYLENISEILSAYQLINSIPAGGIMLETDQEDSFNDDTDQYVRVTDSRFADLSDVDNYLSTYLTEEFAESHSYIKDYFTVQNDNLYLRYSPRAYKYIWNTGIAPEITEKSENSFTFIQAYEVPGAVEYAKLTMVKSDEHPGWKIDSIEDIPN